MDDLAGRTAVVTGAGSGIGRALTARLAREQMTVVAADLDVPALDATVHAVRAAGGRAIGVPTDVSDAGSVARLADHAFAECGAVHLLCNNAGVFAGGLLWERPLADFDWTLGVNLYGIIHAIRSFVPRMLVQTDDSHIVNTASMGGLVTNAFSGPYYASKFAAVGITECLAHDLANVGARIGVSVLVPSLVATGIAGSEQRRLERFVERGAEITADAAFVTQALRDSTASGLAPEEVADIVVTGVRAGDFYIPTKPSYDRQITERYEDMRARRRPRSPVID